MTISGLIPKRLDVALLFIASLLAALALLGAERVHAQNGVIEIAKIDGRMWGDTINVNYPETRFVLRYRNTTGERVNVYNSWQISSPDGAVWLDSHLDTLGPFSGGRSLFTSYFQAVHGVFDGGGYSTPDTLGFSGTGAYSNPATMLPVGFDDTVLAIRLSLGPASANNGKHICIDSASHGPNPAYDWHWQSVTDPQNPVTYMPSFNGAPGIYNSGSGYCFTLWECPGLPPIITNAPVLITGRFCEPMRFDFDAMDPEGDPYSFQLVSGPGSIDPTTGVWTWDNITATDIGSDSLIIGIRDDGGCGGYGPRKTVLLSVMAGSVAITGGFGTTSHLTDQLVQTQMTVNADSCPADAWSVVKTMGRPATYSISPTGLLQFTTAIYGLYQLDVIAHAGEAADTSSHSYIVHGGHGCCQGLRGNVNLTGITDLSDLSLLIAYLTTPYIALPCWDAADIDGNGIVDIADLSRFIGYILAHSTELPACP